MKAVPAHVCASKMTSLRGVEGSEDVFRGGAVAVTLADFGEANRPSFVDHERRGIRRLALGIPAKTISVHKRVTGIGDEHESFGQLLVLEKLSRVLVESVDRSRIDQQDRGAAPAEFL